MENSCCFFGHRDAMDSIRSKLKEEIIRLIEEHGVNDYYVGNQGGFDSLVLSVMKELTVSYPQIRYSVVLAYLPDEKRTIPETNTIEMTVWMKLRYVRWSSNSVMSGQWLSSPIRYV